MYLHCSAGIFCRSLCLFKGVKRAMPAPIPVTQGVLMATATVFTKSTSVFMNHSFVLCRPIFINVIAHRMSFISVIISHTTLRMSSVFFASVSIRLLAQAFLCLSIGSSQSATMFLPIRSVGADTVVFINSFFVKEMFDEIIIL